MANNEQKREDIFLAAAAKNSRILNRSVVYKRVDSNSVKQEKERDRDRKKAPVNCSFSAVNDLLFPRTKYILIL